MEAADFRSLRAILFDMDGVWFISESPVPGAVETLAHLRRQEIPMRFITNTTTRTLREIAGKMRRMGLDISEDEIINAPQAAVLFLRERGRPSCHFIVDDNVRGEFSEFPESDTPDFVVIGDVGDRWSYTLLNNAFRMVMDGAEILAMHKGRYWQVEEGLRLDIGAFVAGLEYATGKEAILVGKPNPLLFRSALGDLGVEPDHAVMIGDDINSDVGGAQAAGIRGVLVKTGKYRDELVAASVVTPDAVIDSVASLRELI